MWPVIRRPEASKTAPHRRYSSAIANANAPSTAVARRHTLLYQGEPEVCRRDYRLFLPVLALLALMVALFRIYRIEFRPFQDLALITLAAFPVHYLTPYRWKKPLFVAVSIAALGWICGPATAVVVVALAAVLIGVCYLPIAWTWRAGLLTAMALLFAACRAEIIAAPVPDGVWPVLATMFMFRMILYLYELRHARKPETLIDTLSYFFLLPNYYFSHFPVVDYRTLQRGYFSREVHETQRAGLQMMFRGTIHLLLYRLINHLGVIPPEEVIGPVSLSRFLATNYLLYLHVSGQFHIACGMLHLFGFQLPDTHRNYLLASSFTDYWRRINIYWKDFMVRVVFNPVVFRLKRWPRPAALAAATAVVFLATWVLHAYQMFWLHGQWNFSLHDALFWGILGVLVMVNVQLDARRSNTRTPRACEPQGLRPLALRVVKTAGTFLTITLLWSLWTSQGVAAWAAMIKRGLGIG